MKSLTLPSALLIFAAAASGQEQTTFTVQIENVSTMSTLKLSTGTTAPAPASPGVWATFSSGHCPFFTPGKADAGQGLESQAEDGSPRVLAKSILKAGGISASGTFLIPVGDTTAGPAFPGKMFEFTFDAEPGEKLSFVSMFGQSNDLFFAPDHEGIPLFSKSGEPLTGDVTSAIYLWDAGTEVNQEPGVGADQDPRQKSPNTGASEGGVVRKAKDSFTYPAPAQVIKVTLTVKGMSSGNTGYN